MLEFTGERLVPGQTGPDLYNEHLSRYLFASRLARGKRVLDVACGAGYGSEALSRSALSVTGIDLSPEAAAAAARTYSASNLSYMAGDATRLPFRDGSFDLVVAFEVIEHLERPAELVNEARRLLAPGGQFVVSTPNKLYYTESRKQSGPNPFHVHEFEYDEFAAALGEVFPSTVMFLQNHAGGLVFRPVAARASQAEIRIEAGLPDPTEAHFFIAVCAMAPQTGSPTFVYVPATANVLREREHHIEKLEGELAQKTAWLDELRAEHSSMVDLYRKQSEEMQEVQQWSRQIDEQLKATGERIVQLQGELDEQQAAAAETAKGYESKVVALEAELVEAQTAAARELERLQTELESRTKEHVELMALLDKAEKTVIERTEWAQSLHDRLDKLQAVVDATQSSRWVRFGRKLGMGPDLTQY